MHSFVSIVLEILKYQERELQLEVFYIPFPNLFLLFLPKGMKREGPVSPYPDGRYMIMYTVCVVHVFLLTYVCSGTHRLKQPGTVLSRGITLGLIDTRLSTASTSLQSYTKKPREIEHHLSVSIRNQQKGKIKVRIRGLANKAGCGAHTCDEGLQEGHNFGGSWARR